MRNFSVLNGENKRPAGARPLYYSMARSPVSLYTLLLAYSASRRRGGSEGDGQFVGAFVFFFLLLCFFCFIVCFFLFCVSKVKY